MLDPVTWTMIGTTAANLIGGYINNKSNARQAQRQMDFQREMADTSMQRSMGDMSAAGINPLFGIAGGGAQVPGGASATMVDPTQSAISSALAVRQAQETYRAAKAQANIAERADMADGVMKAPLFVRSGEWSEKFTKALQEKWLEELRAPGVANKATSARAALDMFDAAQAEAKSKGWRIVNDVVDVFSNATGIRGLLGRLKQ